MTTTVIVKTHAGWPVDVHRVDPASGEALAAYPKERVEPNAERTFYVHSGMDLRVHEVQPSEIDEAPPA